MFRLASKQVLKPKAIHHHHHLFRIHHPSLLRGVCTVQRLNKDNRYDTGGAFGLTDSSGGSKSCLSHVPLITYNRFGRLEEDVSIVKAKVAHLEAGQSKIVSELRDLGNKLDTDLKDLSKKMDMALKGRQSKIRAISDKIRDLSNKIRGGFSSFWQWIGKDFFMLLFIPIIIIFFF
ncbi:hypothetical protein HOY80DRAFT_972816 [Tuber brumale]|nr:hypothetical protein HOY80DRAFT_972816 [Tuber brumale]